MQLTIAIQQIVHTGKEELDGNLLKCIKQTCKSDPSSLNMAYTYITKYMKRKHSQVHESINNIHMIGSILMFTIGRCTF